MLKIVYPICCGMDVHKNFLVACIAITDDKGITTYKSKRFSTYSCSLRECRDWLLKYNCKDVCMESTGKYWIPIYNILESDCNIVLAHPKYVKAICGKKKTTRISRAGAYIKPLLVQCANAAIKSKKHPDVRNRYLDISKTLSYLICQIFICLNYIP